MEVSWPPILFIDDVEQPILTAQTGPAAYVQTRRAAAAVVAAAHTVARWSNAKMTCH